MLSPRMAKVMLNSHQKSIQEFKDTYYISGPMTGLPDYNRPAFNDAANYLRSQGYTVWNPAEEFSSEVIYPRRVYMRRDIEALLKCQAIVMLQGWENSDGARLELEIARELEMNIFFLGDNNHMRPTPEKLPEDLRDTCPYCGRAREYDDGHGRPRCPKQGCAGQHSGWNKPTK